MRQYRLDRELAGDFTMRFSAHSVREHIQLQRGIRRKAVLVIFSDATQVGARAGLNAQKEPIRLAVKSCKTTSKSLAIAPRSLYHSVTRAFRVQPAF